MADILETLDARVEPSDAGWQAPHRCGYSQNGQGGSQRRAHAAVRREYSARPARQRHPGRYNHCCGALVS